MNLSQLIALSLLCFGFAQTAHADVFVYDDPDYGYSLTFPDTWRQQNATGTDQFKIGPMHGDNRASCAMSVVRDGRLTIYPEPYLQAATPLTLDESFWKTEVLPDHKHYQVMKYHAPAGLGQAFATSLQWTWGSILVKKPMNVTDVNPVGLTPMAPTGEVSPEGDLSVTSDASNVMRAMSIATIYGDHRYRFTCQSQADGFERWQPVFADIFASVKFEEKYAAYPTGYYRDFLSDKPLLEKVYR